MSAGKIALSSREPSYDIGTVIDPRHTSADAEKLREEAHAAARKVAAKVCADDAELAEVLAYLGIEAA